MTIEKVFIDSLTYRIEGVFKFGEHVELQVFFGTNLVQGGGLGQQSTHID